MLENASWLDKLRKEDHAPVRDIGTMGWRYEDGKRIGFAFGNKFYHEDGQTVPLVTAADDEFRKWYTPVGKREAWIKAARLLTDRKRPELDVLVAMAFAAPLTVFSGTFYGAVLSVWGEPGTSKSTAQQVSTAVWGHPKQTRESLNSTPKALQGRLGRTRNLPAYLDDIQDRHHQDNLFHTLFTAAEGTEGSRLNRDGSMAARLEWQTLLAVCSNASFVEFLILRKKSSSAAMRRIFEINFKKDPSEPGIIDGLDASKIFAELEHNYGVIGAEYAQLLAHFHDKIDGLVSTITKKFTASVEGTTDEAYWWSLCGVLLTGAALARRLGAELDVGAMETFLRETYRYNRRIRSIQGTKGAKGVGAGSYADTERGLIGFVNEAVGNGNALFTNKRYEHWQLPIKILHSPGEGCQIVVQIIRDSCRIIVSGKAFARYLREHVINSREIINGLEYFYKAKQRNLTLGAGTPYNTHYQEMCWEIPAPPQPDHALYKIICSKGTPTPHYERPTLEIKPGYVRPPSTGRRARPPARPKDQD